MTMSKKNTPKLVQDDPWLAPYEDEISDRITRYTDLLNTVQRDYKNLKDFAGAYKELGIHYNKKEKGWYYREWAPEAYSLSLTGEFNGWNRTAHKLAKNHKGIWEIFIPKDLLKEGDLIKVHIVSKNGAHDRIPAYIFRVIQDPISHDFSGQVWDINKNFDWTDNKHDLSIIG